VLTLLISRKPIPCHWGGREEPPEQLLYHELHVLSFRLYICCVVLCVVTLCEYCVPCVGNLILFQTRCFDLRDEGPLILPGEHHHHFGRWRFKNWLTSHPRVITEKLVIRS